MAGRIYATYLNTSRLDDFINAVSAYGINCVADFRSTTQHAGSASCEEEKAFKSFLQSKNISYHAFFSEMQLASSSHRSRNGVWKYEKAREDDNVTAALDRLVKGYDLGYVIAIVDDETEVEKSFRKKLVGRYLYEQGCQVHYILEQGRLASHAQLDAIKERQKSKRQASNTLGAKGEDIAAQYLEQQGFTILDRNWNLHQGCEIDIVARRGEVFHFIEVKTRKSDRLSAPVEAINYQKFRNICKAVNAYRGRNGYASFPFLIDSIGIVYHSENDYEINYYEDIGSLGNW